MCALFVQDETIIHPRYLHIFLDAMCDELLVPLMCGATNVTMSSGQLYDVIIPVPELALQKEVVDSHLVTTTAATMIHAAESLRDSSSNEELIQSAKRIIREIERLLNSTAKRASVSDFLPL